MRARQVKRGSVKGRRLSDKTELMLGVRYWIGKWERQHARWT